MKAWRKMSAEEARLTSTWYKQDHKTPSEIAKLLHRSKSTITRQLKVKTGDLKQGRQATLTNKQIDSLLSTDHLWNILRSLSWLKLIDGTKLCEVGGCLSLNFGGTSLHGIALIKLCGHSYTIRWVD